MAQVRTRITDFTGGEFSPLLRGRVDLDQYFRACVLLENFLLLQGGGVRRRPGSRYVTTAAGSGKARLIPFVFSEFDAYVLEFTAGKIRFARSTGRIESPPGTPIEVATTYAEGELFSIKWVQSADVLILVHPAHPPAKLERLKSDGTLWRLRDIVFTPPPSTEYGLRPPGTVTPAATSGAGITFTASVATFLASDVGREIQVLAGASLGARAKVTVFTDTTHVNADITEAFANTSAIAATDWKLADSPQTGLTPGAKSPVGTNTTLTLAANGWRATDVGSFVHVNGGVFQITAFTSALVVNATILSEATAVTLAPAGAWSLEEAAFSALNGYPAVTTFFEDRLWFMNTVTQPQTMWASKSGDYFNFAIGALDDDALQFTLNSDQVNPIRWARGGVVLQIGTSGEEWVVDPGQGQVLTPKNFSAVSNSSYGSTGLVPPQRIGIVTLFTSRSRRKVRELAFDFYTNAYVAADLTLLADHLTAPIHINGRLEDRTFVDAAWQRENQQTVWYVRADGTLCSLTYLREQKIIGWARHVFNDLTDTDPDGRQIPPGFADGSRANRIESVCVIPSPDGVRDEVWISNARNVGGGTVRHLEYMDETGLNFEQGLVVDGARTYDGQQYTRTLTLSAETGNITMTASSPMFSPGNVGMEIRAVQHPARALITGYVSPTAVTGTVLIPFTGLGPTLDLGQWGLAFFTFGDLAHLEQRQVQITGDGAVYPPQTVNGGVVTVSYAAMKAEVGIGYRSVLEPMPPEVAGVGTIQGLPQRMGKLYLRLRETVGLTINGKLQPFRKGGDPLGTGVDPFTGFLDLTNLGWSREAVNTIEQTQALPATILGLFALLSTED